MILLARFGNRRGNRLLFISTLFLVSWMLSQEAKAYTSYAINNSSANITVRECLQGMSATKAIDSETPAEQAIAGQQVYRSFSTPIPLELADGAHVLHLGLESEGVTLNASRTYDVPFNLNRASIAVKNLTIIHNGAPAADGLETNSIGRFGIRMEGGSGIGFAEEIK